MILRDSRLIHIPYRYLSLGNAITIFTARFGLHEAVRLDLQH